MAILGAKQKVRQAGTPPAADHNTLRTASMGKLQNAGRRDPPHQRRLGIVASAKSLILSTVQNPHQERDYQVHARGDGAG